MHSYITAVTLLAIMYLLCCSVCVYDLVVVLAEGLQYVSLAGVVAVGVLQALEESFLQNQHRDTELVPQQLHTANVHNDVDRIGQQLQGELSLQQSVDLLHMI